MKDFELRKTRAFCRLCECTSEDEMIVIPFRYSGKSAPIILCKGCIRHLHDTVFPAPKTIYGTADDWEPTMRFFRED